MGDETAGAKFVLFHLARTREADFLYAAKKESLNVKVNLDTAVLTDLNQDCCFKE